MDFLPDENADAFRREVRAFLRDQLPAELSARMDGIRSSRSDLVQWQRILNAHGWGAPYWPQEYGGPGWSAQQRLIFDEECAAAGAPTQDGFAQKLVGPVLNHFASPEQKAEHLPPIFSADRLWCQGFSEPGSGSDLASLRTLAERDGDHYVVNGQKIWTSYAHEADWIFLLVRTDRTVKKQAGISFLLVDMKTPGITVRPIASIDSRRHLNETFFDNVRVPVGNLVGAEGEGWKITKFLLNNEHASAAGLPTLLRLQRQLRNLASGTRGGASLAQRHEFLLRLARYDAEVRAIALMVQRVAAMEGDHGPAAHAMGSILKFRGTELQQKMTEFLVESLGDYGAVACASSRDLHGADEPNWMPPGTHHTANEMFFRRASTIYGGTSEIQRGIVAKTMFQL
ncbi:acyl-CoA dehydrogenase [Cupriavidus necator]|uniref:Acyl-CoA dehydrogenase n=1 Tax=Cupriavidus necator TaxID=106590 RepID=A0A1U9UML7_CUPNE|nr:acyl-CoA dehydrogenase family protein [Cupriavidus necator]AQV94036.1 acyl-CoA dehydrogenase [Cupriavidus necator]